MGLFDQSRVLVPEERVQGRLQDLCQSVTAEGEAVQKSLLDLRGILKTGRPTDKVQGWYEAYNRLKKTIPETLRFIPTKFDALTNRVVYSRQDLNQFWSATVQEIRSYRLWQIRPLRLIAAIYQDMRITVDFASNFRMNHNNLN